MNTHDNDRLVSLGRPHAHLPAHKRNQLMYCTADELRRIHDEAKANAHRAVARAVIREATRRGIILFPDRYYSSSSRTRR